MSISFSSKKRIGIIGGGPSGLFLFKSLLEAGRNDSTSGFSVDIFEAQSQLGMGMPYSAQGANLEHLTNVSGNEIPELVTSLKEWIATVSEHELKEFDLKRPEFHDYKVVPRLLFGKYLKAQFDLLIEKATDLGIVTQVHLNTRVSDIVDLPERGKTVTVLEDGNRFDFEHVVICSGHNWPRRHEERFPGYFDSPYPPSKLNLRLNHPVAIRGSSLTAFDAVRTLARSNGEFSESASGKTSFEPHAGTEEFKIVMHSRNGLLPCIRFHLDDPRLAHETILSPEEITRHMRENGGFVSLDFIFERDFKDSLKEKDHAFYDLIKDMTMEDFVAAVLSSRERQDPFELFKKEYEEAQQSIDSRESIHWKEMLAVLSFALNVPAKHLSAEDMLRLQHVLMPLISIVIAFAPQSSCEELIALHEAGKLEIVSVGEDCVIEPNPDGGATVRYADDSGNSKSATYQTYVDCAGQPHLEFKEFIFESLMRDGSVVPAFLKFKSPQTGKAMMAEGRQPIVTGENGEYFLKVPGIAINDCFQVVDSHHKASRRIYIMAVPYIGGFNPDYSGLDFCEEASERIVKQIRKELRLNLSSAAKPA